jgi:hypothetical protein
MAGRVLGEEAGSLAPLYIGAGASRAAPSPSQAGGPSGLGRNLPPSLISSFKLNGSLSPYLI